MHNKLTLYKTDGLKILTKIFLLLIVIIATIVLFMSVSAFIIYRIDYSGEILIPVSTAVLALSVFIDSFFISKKLKENGMFIGLFIGFLSFLIIIILSFYNNSFNFSQALAVKLAASLLSGAIGGIVGVNVS